MNASLREELEKWHEASYGWALQCCGGETELAQEVLQSAYLKVLEGKAVFKAKSGFKTWFFAVL